jgi:hypothetical protein
MKIEIIEDKEKVYVNIQIKKYHGKNHPVKQKVILSDVRKIISEKNMKVEELLEGPPYLTNNCAPPILSGQWVFKKHVPAKQVKKPASANKRQPSKSTRSRKRKKTLDKSL